MTTLAEPGTSFVHLADQPGVCVVVRGGTAVTVLPRALCRGRGAVSPRPAGLVDTLR